MNNTARHMATLCCLGLVFAAGCRWNTLFRRSPVEPPPIAFAALPSPLEAATAVNANTQRVQSLQSQGATISIPGAPAISAEVAIERPQRLRLRASAPLLGPELDLGSNDELFWFWAARAPEGAVFFARHDQFGTSRARQMLPIEPAWLIEALGLVEIDPQSIYEGPVAAGNDRVQLRASLPRMGVPYSRLMVLHARYGWVLEQHVYDERGQLVASARNSGHEYSPVDGVTLPKRIEVQVPQSLLSLQLDVDRWAINQPLDQAAERFALPREQLAQYPFVDLADPNFVPPGGPPEPAATGPARPPARTSFPRLRGFSQLR